MVRLKIAYWEFDFEAVCPTLDHDLLSQAHIHKNKQRLWSNINPGMEQTCKCCTSIAQCRDKNDEQVQMWVMKWWLPQRQE